MQVAENLTPTQIILQNLDELSVLKTRLDKAKIAHLAELVYELCRGDPDLDSIRSAVLDCDLDRSYSSLLCKLLAKNIDRSKTSVDLVAFKALDFEPSVSYFRNVLSDKAHRKFSETIKGLGAVYFDSLSACCDDVSYGSSQFCMLPCEDFQNGQMWTVRSLLKKHDLFIVAQTSVISDSFENPVTFEILSKEPYVIKGANTLKVSFFCDSANELADFLSGSAELGATVKSVTQLPYSIYETTVFDVSFEISKDDLSAFGLYCLIFYPRLSILGYYKTTF